LKKVGAVLAAIVLLTPIAVGQILSHTQISLNVTEDYSKQSNGTSDAQTVNLKPTRATGYLGTLRYSLSSRSAVELNYGYLRNSQNYLLTDSTGFQTAFGINATVHEATAAYVYNVRKIYRFNPFVLGGAGVLIFIPTGNSLDSTGIGYENQNRLSLLYGVGTDFRLTAGFALRMQFRGLLYKAPDFTLSTYTTNAYGHLAEPSVGIVYNF
jgi:outer membrane immunogenic protein